MVITKKDYCTSHSLPHSITPAAWRGGVHSLLNHMIQAWHKVNMFWALPFRQYAKAGEGYPFVNLVGGWAISFPCFFLHRGV